MSSGMKTRKNDGRPTSNSGKRNLISANVGTKTKKRRVQDKPIPTNTTNNETSNKNNSGTSSSDNSDEEYENATDTENDNEMDPPKKPSGKKNQTMITMNQT